MKSEKMHDRATDDLISRQAAIDKINERQRKLIYCFGFENDMVKIMDIAKSIIIAMPSAQPEYEELTPEEAASEIASGSIMSASYWLGCMIQIEQMGYAICRKKG